MANKIPYSCSTPHKRIKVKIPRSMVNGAAAPAQSYNGNGAVASSYRRKTKKTKINLPGKNFTIKYNTLFMQICNKLRVWDKGGCFRVFWALTGSGQLFHSEGDAKVYFRVHNYICKSIRKMWEDNGGVAKKGFVYGKHHMTYEDFLKSTGGPISNKRFKRKFDKLRKDNPRTFGRMKLERFRDAMHLARGTKKRHIPPMIAKSFDSEKECVDFLVEHTHMAPLLQWWTRDVLGSRTGMCCAHKLYKEFISKQHTGSPCSAWKFNRFLRYMRRMCSGYNIPEQNSACTGTACGGQCCWSVMVVSASTDPWRYIS